MRKLFFVVGLILVAGAVHVAHADDVTCPAPGYYLNDAGECVVCNETHDATHYCPGDNTRVPCPDPTTRVREFPAEYYNPTYGTFLGGSGAKISNITACRAYTELYNIRGILFEYTNYNPETDKYDNNVIHGWFVANPGYYLTTRSGCGTFAYYTEALGCPAGAYCPGKERVVCNESNAAEVHTETFGLEICPDNTYSDAGATACTPCPHGYGNSGATPDAHAGIASCNTPIVCNVGYYLNDNNECKACPGGYYCENQDSKTECPDDNTDWAGHSGMTVVRTSGKMSWGPGFWADGATKQDQCYMGAHLSDKSGTVYKECPWNGTDYWCGNELWYIAASGYYLSGYISTTANPWYRSVKQCTNAPENAHYTGAGTPDDPVTSGGRTDYNDCPWECDMGYSWKNGACIKCPAGEYLNDAGECVACEIGYYCPGDNGMYNCTDLDASGKDGYCGAPYYSDERGLSACKECPQITDPNIIAPSAYWYWIATCYTPESFIHTDKDHCRAGWDINLSHGYAGFSCAYGSDGYSGTDKNKCFHTDSSCDAGYYVNPNRSGMNSYFEIDDTFYMDSYSSSIQQDLCEPVGYGYYSANKKISRTACSAGTFTRTDTSTSADACLPLCDAGISRFHAGDYSFLLWNNSVCASPALRVGTDTGTCCVNLESGAASGALNINTGTATYHTVN